MDITGSCISILEPQVFQSKRDGGRVAKYSFVIDTGGQYAKRVCFHVFGDDKFKQMQLVVGKTYAVSFDVESREWNGKWFTECTAWKCVLLDSNVGASNNVNAVNASNNVVSPSVAPQTNASSPSAGVVSPSTKADSDVDLPF